MTETGLAIRRLGPADYPRLVAYLQRDQANNLYHLANLAQYGMQDAELRYYGAFDGDALVGELMLFRENAAVYWDDVRVLPYFRDIIVREGVAGLSGCRPSVEPLLQLLPAGAIWRQIVATFATVTEETLLPWPARGERLATFEDVESLTNLYSQNLLFSRQTRMGHRARIEKILRTRGMIALVERDGMAVSAARTSAMGFGMAMIGGVVTLPAYRGQGFATACTGLLSRRLLEQGYTPYLTYNPQDRAASRVYECLGYQPIDEWLIVFIETEMW